jgi:hypothetical protein
MYQRQHAPLPRERLKDVPQPDQHGDLPSALACQISRLAGAIMKAHRSVDIAVAFG